MSFKKQLEELIANLEGFELEIAFQDDTIIDILELREEIESGYDKLNKDEKEQLFYIDEIINGYANIYQRRELSGYEKLAFKTLQKINVISAKRLNKIRMVA